MLTSSFAWSVSDADEPHECAEHVVESMPLSPAHLHRHSHAHFSHAHAHAPAPALAPAPTT